MDNNRQPQPKFDPETGRPLQPQKEQQPAPRFDPETGRPLTPPPAQSESPKPRLIPKRDARWSSLSRSPRASIMTLHRTTSRPSPG